MSEPEILTSEPGAVALDELDAATVVEITKADFDAAIAKAEERAVNRTWAEARKTYPKERLTALMSRVEKLETLMQTVLSIQFPGLGVPTNNTTDKEVANG